MFTGIVRSIGRVAGVSTLDGVMRLEVKCEEDFLTECETGASIAVDGVCLTVVSIDDNMVNFDVITETVEKTTLGSCFTGQMLNMERSLRFGDEIGGHILSGHVSGTGSIVQATGGSGEHDLEIDLGEIGTRYIMEKGFIAVDGISLTVGKVTERTFWVHLIPETLNRTTIMGKEVGDDVNIEFDSQTVATVDTLLRIQGESV